MYAAGENHATQISIVSSRMRAASSIMTMSAEKDVRNVKSLQATGVAQTTPLNSVRKTRYSDLVSVFSC